MNSLLIKDDLLWMERQRRDAWLRAQARSEETKVQAADQTTFTSRKGRPSISRS